jgi:hypothetical protein
MSSLLAAPKVAPVAALKCTPFAHGVPTGNRHGLRRVPLRGQTPWYVPPALGRIGAHRSFDARALAPLCLAAVALGGCGGGSQQDANEPKGNFAVEVVKASFPAKQRLAATSNLTVVVRNPGPKRIPNISVTVKCASPGRSTGGSGGSASGEGGSGGAFGYRSTQPGLADPVRPQFVVNTVPTRTPRNYDHGRLDPLERSSSYVDTYPLGPLAAGRTVTFRWNVTSVKAGPFRICYRVNAGLGGKARAVPSSSGAPISGEFAGAVIQRPPQAHVGEDGKTVVQGPAVSGSAP